MVLAKNNTKGNEVLLQNIVLKKRKMSFFYSVLT